MDGPQDLLSGGAAVGEQGVQAAAGLSEVSGQRGRQHPFHLTPEGHGRVLAHGLGRYVVRVGGGELEEVDGPSHVPGARGEDRLVRLGSDLLALRLGDPF